MGNQNIESQHQIYNNHHQKNTFLPMLCSRPSIKEVNLPRCRMNPPSCNDPLSPRIGCMGQVKRNNKIAGFPSSQYKVLSFNNKSSSIISPVVKYSKLKKLFSGKNLINTPSNITISTTKQRVVGGSNNNSNSNIVNVPRNIQRCVKNENVGIDIKIDEMDPPLPVIKRVNILDEGNKSDNSLWKRRSAGSRAPPLTSLQLQQIQDSKICIQPTTV